MKSTSMNIYFIDRIASEESNGTDFFIFLSDTIRTTGKKD